MLIQFSIKNYKTFKDLATLSMVASNYDKDTREEDNIKFDARFSLRLLKSAVIYGPNAGGKSKLVEALAFMRRFVISSSKDSQKGEPIDVEPFRLNTATEKASSEFEVVFIHKNVQYRYGFEVDSKQVVAEWLFHKPKTKEVELFYRDYQEFELHPRKFTKGNMLVKENFVRDNALMLSVAAQFNDSIAIEVVNWFKDLKIISGLKEEGYRGFTMNKMMDPIQKQRILELLKAADLGIQDIHLQKLELDQLPKDMPKALREMIEQRMQEENAEFFADVFTMHRKYNENKQFVENVSFSMNEDESSGTRKFFAISGPILDVIENGYTLVVDELDAKLHPNLVCKIIALFNSKALNPKQAQLIINSHDTNLLSSGLFRRDQIWFTEKNKYGEAKLYSLADFKSGEVRKSESFEDNYIKGKYGAVPFLAYFEELIHNLPTHDMSR